jgi:predicted transcriptional regulator
MEKEILLSLIEKGFSQRQIAVENNCSQGSVKHWLKKYDLKTKGVQFNKKHNFIDKKQCTLCNEIKNLEEFYPRNNKTKASYCKICSNLYHSERVKKIKLKMIAFKGSNCEHCNLSIDESHYAVFEFHHKNPETKDPNFKKIKYQKWSVIEKELDKCVLLCANCHRVEHAKIPGW